MAVNIKYRAPNPVVHTDTTIKNSPLSNEEIDGNFKNVKDAVETIQGSGGAAAVGFTPSGGLAATNVQSAINEVVSDLAAGTGASLVGYTPAGTGAVATNVQGKLRESVSVLDFGAVGDGTTDDRANIQTAFDHIAANGGTLYFPPGEYVISSYVTLKGANGAAVSARGIRILGGPDVVIRQTNASANYPRDGFRIGNASAQDGGTGSAINVQDIVVDGFEFKNCRIGVWVVYARDVLVQNIKADRSAVVAVGNDADDDCENVTVRNIYRTDAFDGTFFTVGFFKTTGFRIENIHSPFAVSGEAITISTSTHGTVNGIYIDQQDSGNSGLALTEGTQYVSVSDFIIRNCSLGIVTIDANAGSRDKVSVIGNGIIEGGVTAISAQASGTIFHDIQTNGNTNSIALGTDAQSNKFRNCTFREGAISDPSGIKYLQTFAACEGVSSRSSFFATDNGGALNVTGDGTDYTMTWNGEITDLNGDFDPATGIFTAPRDGLYRFEGAVFLVDWGSSGYSVVQLKLATTPRTIVLDYRVIASNGHFHGSALVYLNRGNTARLIINASGGSKNADINTDASFNYFGGALVSGGEL